MSLYPLYLKEREGIEVLEKEQGFATYKVRSHDCYIIDIYVVPEARKSGLASQMANEIAEIAKANGIKILTGSVDTRDKEALRNEKVLLAYGMRKAQQEDHMIYFYKELT